MNRRTIIKGIAASVAVGLSPAVAAQERGWPARPVRLIVPFSAGGIADSTARLVGQRLSERLGQPVVVENRSGAGGNIGAKLVAGAESDGYTLLVTTAAFAVNLSLYKEPGYQLADFAPLALAASTPNLFAVGAATKAASLQELAALYKGKSLHYATAGNGSSSHLIGQYLFKNLMGLDATHVPYQGGAPAVAAAVAGHVDLVSVSLPTALSNVTAGRLKGVAVASLKRVSVLPDVPAVAEAGFKDFEDRSWVVVMAPARTPAAIRSRLTTEINAIVQTVEVRERLLAGGYEPGGGSAKEVLEYVQREAAKWAAIVKATGIQPGS